jgi:hypothetical protein
VGFTSSIAELRAIATKSEPDDVIDFDAMFPEDQLYDADELQKAGEEGRAAFKRACAIVEERKVK